MTLSLWKHKIHTNKRHKEWEEGNLTYMVTLDDDCFYQGQVSSEINSFVAVSLCDGMVSRNDGLRIIDEKER